MRVFREWCLQIGGHFRHASKYYINSSSAAYICSGNGLSPVRRKAITLTYAGLLSIGPLETNFSEIRIEIQNVLYMKMQLATPFAKWQPFYPGVGDELVLHRRSLAHEVTYIIITVCHRIKIHGTSQFK